MLQPPCGTEAALSVLGATVPKPEATTPGLSGMMHPLPQGQQYAYATWLGTAGWTLQQGRALYC